MKTRKITLFYEITPTAVRPPTPEQLARKDEWLKEIQRSVPSEWDPKMVRVSYELFNPETQKIRKFFEGPVVEYFAIQTNDMLTGRPSRSQLDEVRETLLSDALGFDVHLIGKVERRRKSTSDFTDTQQWNDMLAELKETHFEPNGYEMPDSDEFWKLSEGIGYERAKEESIKSLQQRLARKLSTGDQQG